MVDEDPNSASHLYMRSLSVLSFEHEIRLLRDKQRNNRLIVICPRLEDWLVRSTRESSLKMTDFGFESDNGRNLHREIVNRLDNVKRLASALLEHKNPRMLRLQSLVNAP